jgi:hypothetical protein
MRVMCRPAYTRIVLDMETLRVTERVSSLYDGPWDEMKGGNSQAEMQRANQISQQQLQMQQQQLAMANPTLRAIIQNGGMLPAQQAAMTSQALNGLGSQYQNLYGSLSSTLAARGITGGDNAGAGALARSFGSLGAQEAGQQSQLLNQIQLEKGAGLQNALGMSLGEAANTGSLGVSALGSGVTAANNADQAQTGFWGSMIGGLAGLGGSAITKYCWVAAELYGGWFAPETVTIRAWLDRTFWMTPFAWLYSRIGPQWAELIRQKPTLRRTTKLLFDLFLRLAHE